MEELRHILLDRERGAAQLLERALRWLAAHPESLVGERRQPTLELLRRSRPAMAGFARLAARLEEEGEASDGPEALLRELAVAEEAVARRFVELLARRPAAARVVTLSWSSSVLRALERAASHVAELGVLESLPGGEGRRLAGAAGAAGLPVTLVPDDGLETAAADSDLGVIGADTVFADGSVLNKVLSARLARALRRRGRPFYVLASTWKASTETAAEHRLGGEEREIFEVVPAALVTAVLDESA